MTETIEQEITEAAAVTAERPIFFMHIAKTAGSYLNARFRAALGDESVATHIEASIGDTAALRARLDSGVRFFSGHVMYAHWRDIAGPLADEFRTICILRDPIEHIASHIQWLDHYNRPEFAREYRHLDEFHRRVVDRIGAVDITEIGQLDRFLADLSGLEVRLFDNCQSRYFVASGRRTYDSIRPLSLSDRFAVSQAVSNFDAVVFQDDLETGVAEISKATGVALASSATRVNPALSDRRIDTSNPVIRQILSRRTLVDQWLWRLLRARRPAGLAQ